MDHVIENPHCSTDAAQHEVAHRLQSPVRGRTASRPAPLAADAYRMLFERVPGKYLVLSPSLCILAATDAFLAETATCREDIVGKGVFEAFPGNPGNDDSSGVDNWRLSLETVLESRLPHTMAIQRYDIRLPGDEGAFHVRYWCPSNIPILDEIGEVQLIIHLTEDVSELAGLKTAQGEWEQAAKGFQCRSDELEATIASQRSQAAILAGQKILDRAASHAKDLRMKGLTDEMEAELSRRESQAVVLANEKILDRAANLAKNNQMQGRADEMQAQLTVQQDQAGVLAKQRVLDRASNTAKEHRLHEEAEQKFNSLLEIAPDSMVIIDRSGTIMLHNTQAEDLFGYSRDEILGQTVDFLLPAGYRLQDADNAAKFFAAPQHQAKGVVIELHGCRQDRTVFPFEVTLSPLQTSDGMLTILAIRDLTERNKLNAQLIRAQRMESIGTFAGNIAHDLNNALAPILMSMELLRIKNPNETELINTMESGANRGAEMLRQLLVFSKGSYIEPKLVETGAMLDEIREVIKTTFPENIAFRTNVVERLRPVLGDATQIHQVLLNLCVNARDAMPDGGVLTLFAENVEIDASYASAIAGAVPGSYVMWRISDTGTGIAADVLDRIFEPFFTTKGHGKGTGLGLSIVVGIVKSHHGFVNAYSTITKGSTFSVYIPAELSDTADTGVPLVVHSTFQGNGEAILMVDDSEGIRSAASSVLDSLNLHVIAAKDGQEALDLVEKFGDKLSAVITDVHMPTMDGLTFVKKLRSILPDIGIIVISGNLDEEEARGFIKLNVSTFLEKPFTQEKLTSALSQVIQR